MATGFETNNLDPAVETGEKRFGLTDVMIDDENHSRRAVAVGTISPNDGRIDRHSALLDQRCPERAGDQQRSPSTGEPLEAGIDDWTAPRRIRGPVTPATSRNLHPLEHVGMLFPKDRQFKCMVVRTLDKI